MASGQPVGIILETLIPATNTPQLTIRSGGSNPVERVTIWAFDAASSENLDFKCVLMGYGGGGLTLTLFWSATSATTGNVRWNAGFRRVADDAEDIDTSQTYDFNAVDDATASASGEVAYTTITFTDGADMDSWANGEIGILRVWRAGAHANDTMSGDAELWGLVIKET